MNSIEDSNAATVRRATKLTRWYSPQWRERYGDEFIAHMEQELRDRPSDFGRTWNIACHGLLNRIETWSRFRFVASLSSVAAVVIAVAVFLASLSSVAPVRLTPGSRGMGIVSVGLVSGPKEVTDLSFNFSTPKPTSVKILSVGVVTLPGFTSPEVIGVDFASHPSFLANIHGWPLRLPNNEPVAIEGDHHPIPVIGKQVELGQYNTLWLGLRTPLVNNAYAVNGLVVHYERDGKLFTASLSQGGEPDVICVRRSPLVFDPTCSGLGHAASSIAGAMRAKSPGNMAQMITYAALGLQFTINRHFPTLRSVEHWAALVKPAKGPFGVQRITEVTSPSQRLFRFFMRRGESTKVEPICVIANIQQNGAYYAATQSCS